MRIGKQFALRVMNMLEITLRGWFGGRELERLLTAECGGKGEGENGENDEGDCEDEVVHCFLNTMVLIIEQLKCVSHVFNFSFRVVRRMNSILRSDVVGFTSPLLNGKHWETS